MLAPGSAQSMHCCGRAHCCTHLRSAPATSLRILKPTPRAKRASVTSVARRFAAIAYIIGLPAGAFCSIIYCMSEAKRLRMRRMRRNFARAAPHYESSAVLSREVLHPHARAPGADENRSPSRPRSGQRYRHGSARRGRALSSVPTSSRSTSRRRCCNSTLRTVHGSARGAHCPVPAATTESARTSSICPCARSASTWWSPISRCTGARPRRACLPR